MNLSEKRILITGSNGFLGTKLQPYLADLGAHLYCFGRKNQDTTTYQHKNNSRKTFFEGDILDQTKIYDAVQSIEPDYILHLAAQSNAGVSYADPSGTCQVNCLGTTNLLEAVRLSPCDPVILFPGSADEYGFVISSKEQYDDLKKRGRTLTPEPKKIPELPVSEDNPLRPVSPYGVSKVFGDHLMRAYHQSYGMKNVVVRSFNIEGAGRGGCFVSSAICRQVAELKKGTINSLSMGNISVLRDFTHVHDALSGYARLMKDGCPGEVYNLGSMRTTSIASYLLHALEESGFTVTSLSTMNGQVHFDDPMEPDISEYAGVSFEKTALDTALLSGTVGFVIEDKGVIIHTNKGKIPVYFDPEKFRPADNPIILADIHKIMRLGYKPQFSVHSIVHDQMNTTQN